MVSETKLIMGSESHELSRPPNAKDSTNEADAAHESQRLLGENQASQKSPTTDGEGIGNPEVVEGQPDPNAAVEPAGVTYQKNKNIAQGMMDIALLSANFNQLRYVLESSGTHPYYYPSLVCICVSLLLQTAVGMGLIWNSRYNLEDDEQSRKAQENNSNIVCAVFLVTVINVFITSFCVATPAPFVSPVPPVLTNTTMSTIQPH